MAGMYLKAILCCGLLSILVQSAPIVFPPQLILDLFPPTIISALLKLSVEQRNDFLFLYAKYRGDAAGLTDDQAMRMFEELKTKDRVSYDVLWPVIMETQQKLARMDKESRSFFDFYMIKADQLAPFLKTQRDVAIHELLSFAVEHWDKMSAESQVKFENEFPQMAHIFQDMNLRKLADIE